MFLLLLLLLQVSHPVLSYVLNQFPVSILGLPPTTLNPSAARKLDQCFSPMSANVNCPVCTKRLYTPANRVENGVELTGYFAHTKIPMSNNWAFGFLSEDIIVYRRFDNGQWGQHQLIQNAVGSGGHWVAMKTNDNVLIASWYHENLSPSYRVYVFKNINGVWKQFLIDNPTLMRKDFREGLGAIFTVDGVAGRTNFGFYPNSIGE